MSFICLDCTKDKSLNEHIHASDLGTTSTCKYCGKYGYGIFLDKFVSLIDTYLRDYCEIGDEFPNLDAESDQVYYEQEGEELYSFLQEELEIEIEPAKEIASLLVDNDSADIRHGDMPFYSDDNKYCRKSISASDYSKLWDTFCLTIKHKNRFFNERVKKIINDIMVGDDEGNLLSKIELKPEASWDKIYRARRLDSKDEVLKILKNPALELGPPPIKKARAGRMNPEGIRVFYGAMSKEAAIAEVRPFVGSLVIVAEFKVIKKLVLLDLSELGNKPTGSIFDNNYKKRASRLQFLRTFHRLIARPVQPNDEPLEYIPTQAIAEYVFNSLKLDGILYGSAQLGAVPISESEYGEAFLETPIKGDLSKFNVVLSGDAATIKKNPKTHSKSPYLFINPKSIDVKIVEKVKYTHIPYNDIELDIKDIEF